MLVRRSVPFVPTLLAVNPNAWFAAVHADVNVRLASPSFELGMASLFTGLTSPMLAFSPHSRQMGSPSTMNRLLENFLTEGVVRVVSRTAHLNKFLGQLPSLSRRYMVQRKNVD